MQTALLVEEGDQQVVRFPPDVRLPGDEVWIKRIGDAVLLLRKSASWETWLSSLDQFSDDFMLERDRPEWQERPSKF